MIWWYGEFTTRTVLQHPSLANVSITLRASPTNQVEAGAAIETALTAKGVRFIPDGTNFVMVVPETHAAEARPHSSALEPSDPTIRKGEINFPFMDIYQVFDYYAVFAKRKPIRPTQYVPNGPIIFYNETPLSKQDVFYALDTLLEWGGVRTVNVGDDRLTIECIPKQ